MCALLISVAGAQIDRLRRVRTAWEQEAPSVHPGVGEAVSASIGSHKSPLEVHIQKARQTMAHATSKSSRVCCWAAGLLG